MNEIKQMEFNKLNKKGEFKVNDFTIIKNFKIISNEVFKFMKFGVEYEYLKFSGEIENKKINGYVCLADENIYNMTYV